LATHLRAEQCSLFDARTSPCPAELGRALEHNVPVPGALLQLCFGERTASLAIPDLWSACCELLLQAQLAREARLDRFVIDAEEIFELSYSGDLILCVFSKEHVFAVSRSGFPNSLEQLVDGIFAATACPQLMRIAAAWGASALRGPPYAFRFSASMLT
jgi:hypothetical protein